MNGVKVWWGWIGLAVSACFAVGCSDDNDVSGLPESPTISISSPAGGEQWLKEVPYTIRWTSTGISGNMRILLSLDGGSSWPHTIIASTPNDGGYEWYVSFDAAPNCQIQIQSVNDEELAAESDTFAIQSLSWLGIPTENSDPLFDLKMVGNEGWAAGFDGTIVHKSATSSSWVEQSSGVTTTLRALSFVSSEIGWAVGDNGTILKTANGGDTWEPQGTPQTETIHGVHALDEEHAWACGQQFLFITTNGGDEWTRLEFEAGIYAYNVFFVSEQIGWLVGSAGATRLIAKTTNSGVNWVPQVSAETGSFFDLHALDEETAVAVGSGGTVLYTSDGGENWVDRSGAALELFGVWLDDEENIWACGRGATLIYSPDAGDNWGEFEIPLQGQYFYSIARGAGDKFYFATGEEYIVTAQIVSE